MPFHVFVNGCIRVTSSQVNVGMEGSVPTSLNIIRHQVMPSDVTEVKSFLT